ncbi:MAG: hypothetical protein B7Y43_00705 [Sphingomonas sp. 28-62-20]|nr:MAG: hypothetical protein B7Y43_00705 [Sphingomonas sp. 28-62-20]
MAASAAVAIAAPNVPAGAATGCLTDAEIDATIGAQIRARSFTINTGPLNDRPLCSGLTLAQRVQQMREATFPEERAAAEARAAETARQRALAVAQAAEAQRAADARAATAAARPDPRPEPVSTGTAMRSSGPLVFTTAALGISLDTLLDRIVEADSQSWMANRYQRGSMHGARYLTSNKAHTTYTAQGNYSFSGFASGTGWVRVRVRDGALDCLEFWDQAGSCRPLYHSLSQQNFVAGAVGLMTSGGGSSSQPSRPDDYDLDRNRNRSSDSPPPPPPPRVTPIGGEGGLYGCAAPPCM